MVGLDTAGKTTLLYRLKLGEVLQTIPTAGFNVEDVEYQNLKFDLWEVGGSDKMRPLWYHFYNAMVAVIFVFDSKDRDQERCDIAFDELHKLSSDLAEKDIPFLIFANKQDCEGAMTMEEVERVLQPHDLRHKKWHIQPCSAKTGKGLSQGFEWIGSIIRPKKE